MEGVQCQSVSTRRSGPPRSGSVSNPRTIRRRIADGTITGYRGRGGRSLRVDQAEVDEGLLQPIPTVNAAS